MDRVPENWREQLLKPHILATITFLAGLFIGLVILGWWLFPVEWVDATPAQLSAEWQEQYMRMAVEAFGQNADAERAALRYQAMGDAAGEALAAVAENPAPLPSALVQAFAEVVGAEVAVVEGPALQETPGVLETPAPGEEVLVTPFLTEPAEATAVAGAEEEEAGGILGTLLPVLCLLALLAIAGGFVYYYMSRRTVAPRPAQTPAQQAQEDTRQAAWTDYSTAGAEAPMAQFMASYRLGDDLFDDSFSIDSPTGEFLGECGVGISETIGVGDPKKVTALEVWLFDKNDIQTVTKVLMSEHAFNEDSVRQRLTAKGEPVLAEPGATAVLETQTLHMVARVVDMGYGSGPLPAESFFDRFIIELAVWQKPEA